MANHDRINVHSCHPRWVCLKINPRLCRQKQFADHESVIQSVYSKNTTRKLDKTLNLKLGEASPGAVLPVNPIVRSSQLRIHSSIFWLSCQICSLQNQAILKSSVFIFQILSFFQSSVLIKCELGRFTADVAISTHQPVGQKCVLGGKTNSYTHGLLQCEKNAFSNHYRSNTEAYTVDT